MKGGNHKMFKPPLGFPPMFPFMGLMPPGMNMNKMQADLMMKMANMNPGPHINSQNQR